ncbi:MAG TPA: hypothetical protein VFA12_15455 [Stellaceae bacterium]|nr:hypothetical protein [Stellaceae bacterium]
MRLTISSVVFGALAIAATALAPAAIAQSRSPAGTWKVSPFEGCTGTFTVDESSARWQIDCTYKGEKATADEVFTRHDLDNGDFSFDIVPEKSSVSNYTMDTKIVLKLNDACSASFDITEPNGTQSFRATRPGARC